MTDTKKRKRFLGWEDADSHSQHFQKISFSDKNEAVKPSSRCPWIHHCVAPWGRLHVFKDSTEDLVAILGGQTPFEKIVSDDETLSKRFWLWGFLLVVFSQLQMLTQLPGLPCIHGGNVSASQAYSLGVRHGVFNGWKHIAKTGRCLINAWLTRTHELIIHPEFSGTHLQCLWLLCFETPSFWVGKFRISAAASSSTTCHVMFFNKWCPQPRTQVLKNMKMGEINPR